MTERFQILHEDMLKDIRRCLQSKLSEKEKADQGFRISRSYGKLLKALMTATGFNSDDEEIDFFRNIKPQFVCYVEYFLVMSEALSAVPEKFDAALVFWEEEKTRFVEFRRQYAAFVSYYESGRHDSDASYFLREKNDFRFVPKLRIYDSDVDWCTSHDRLVRNYLAYSMYHEFCDRKCAQIPLNDEMPLGV